MREWQRPLLERVKEIFKKYGWTLEAVVLAAGITISAVVLATLNGLKAATKAIGNGLKDIGTRATGALPGLIGSIVSFIFKAARQAISYVAEHAWLLILAVVAFLVERVTKRARSWDLPMSAEEERDIPTRLSHLGNNARQSKRPYSNEGLVRMMRLNRGHHCGRVCGCLWWRHCGRVRGCPWWRWRLWSLCGC